MSASNNRVIVSKVNPAVTHNVMLVDKSRGTVTILPAGKQIPSGWLPVDKTAFRDLVINHIEERRVAELLDGVDYE